MCIRDRYIVHCNGGAGQSFGAFVQKGITLDVHGDANDYFGKGLSEMCIRDSNRTSPFAFTGNKFEFRMPGSNSSIAGCNIV